MKKKKTNLTNKASKHLKKNWIKYGFETFVVIVGILIAFGLTNWNENRLENIKEINYLERLAKDLQADTNYYNDRIASSEFVITYHQEFIRKIYLNQENFKEVEDLFSPLTWNSQLLTTQNATYIELTSSGNLDILRNQDLKERIIQYYRKNEEAAKHVAEFNEFSARYLNYLFEVLGNSTKFYRFINDLYEGMDFIGEKDWAFINDPSSEKFQALESVLSMYRYKHQVFLDYFNNLKSISSQLIVDIEKEHKSRD